MRFDNRALAPYRRAIDQLPGTINVRTTAKGPNGNQPVLDVTAASMSDAQLIDDIVEDRIEIARVDIAVGRNSGRSGGRNNIERAKSAISRLDGVTSVSSDEHRLVVGASPRNAEFLSNLLEDNIYGKDVYFKVGR